MIALLLAAALQTGEVGPPAPLSPEDQMVEILKRQAAKAAAVEGGLSRLPDPLRERAVAPTAPVRGSSAPAAAGAVGVRSPRGPREGGGNGDGRLPRAERAILTAIAQRHPERCSRIQAAILSGYSINSSSFQNALGALRSGGLVEGLGDDNRITQHGLETLGPFDAAPSGEARVQWWLSKLPKAERALLSALVEAHPAGLDRENLAEGSGYSITSSSFQNALGKLRTLQLAGGDRGGRIAASEDLFS